MIRSLFLPLTSYKYLLYQLIQREIKARYKQSVLGYAWVIVNPLLQLMVYSFVFSVIFKFPTNNIPYSVFLFIGLLPWTYLQSSLSSITLSLVDNSDLIRKVAFPREVFVYSIVIAKFIDLLFASLVLIAFLIFYHVTISVNFLFIIPLIICQMLLMAGIGFIFSTGNLFYRDTQYLVNLLLMLWMYLSPVVYPLALVPKNWVWLYKLNPMVGIIEGYRSSLLGYPFDTGTILWSTGLSLAIFIIGFIIFKNTEKIFADIV